MKTLTTTTRSLKIKKNGQDLTIGVGNDSQDPQEITLDALKYRSDHVIYINYEGQWYKTRYSSISDCHKAIAELETYSQEQLFEAIYKIIYGK